MLNKVLVLGNLTRDPDLRTTTTGKNVAEFSIAVNEKRPDAEDKVNYFDVTAWGKLADVCREYLTKGSRVIVEGKLSQERWEDRNSGEKRSKIRIIAENIQFLDTRNPASPANTHNANNGYSEHRDAKANGYQPQSPRVEEQYAPPLNGEELPANDDIPF